MKKYPTDAVVPEATGYLKVIEKMAAARAAPKKA
jgi:hypothetical protein